MSFNTADFKKSLWQWRILQVCALRTELISLSSYYKRLQLDFHENIL